MGNVLYREAEILRLKQLERQLENEKKLFHVRDYPKITEESAVVMAAKIEREILRALKEEGGARGGKITMEMGENILRITGFLRERDSINIHSEETKQEKALVGKLWDHLMSADEMGKPYPSVDISLLIKLLQVIVLRPTHLQVKRGGATQAREEQIQWEDTLYNDYHELCKNRSVWDLTNTKVHTLHSSHCKASNMKEIFPFTPEIAEKSKKIVEGSPTRKDLSVEEVLLLRAKERDYKLEKARKEAEKRETRECRAVPQVNKDYVSANEDTNYRHRTDLLYNINLERRKRQERAKAAGKLKTSEEKVLELHCTFQPSKQRKSARMNIFVARKPNDFYKTVDRIRKAKEDREAYDAESERRLNGKEVKVKRDKLGKIVPEPFHSVMWEREQKNKYVLEGPVDNYVPSNKDEILKRAKQSFLAIKNGTNNISPADTDNIQIEELEVHDNLLLFVDISVAPEQIERIAVYKGEKAEDVASVFCALHGLDQTTQAKLTKVLERQIQAEMEKLHL